MADESRAGKAAAQGFTDAGQAADQARRNDQPAATPASNGQLARRVAVRLKHRIGQERFRAWFGSDAAQLRVDGDKLRVDSQNQFVANWIDRNFAGDLRMAAREALGDGARVDVTVAPAPSPARPGEERAPARQHDTDRTRQRRASSARPGDDSRPPHAPGHITPPARHVTLRKLSDFVVGECNRLAFTAAGRVAESTHAPDTAALLIYGDCGVGKTHLLQGICERYAERTGRPDTVRYITAEQFTNDYITAIRLNSLDDFRKEYRRLALLAIDDVHFLASKEGTQKEFLHTLDAIDLSGARIVLASDEHPRKIGQLNPSLVSRLVSRLVVRIEPPGRAMRLEIARRLAAQRGLTLLKSAADMIASRCTGSVRDIVGIVAQLAAIQELTPGDDPVEIGTLQIDRLIREHDPLPRSGPVRLAAIVEAVCEHRGIDRSDLIGRGRHPRVVLGRGLVAYLARDLTSHSYPEIACALGRSCHSTVHAADRRISAMVATAKNRDGSASLASHGNGNPGPAEVERMIEELRSRILRQPARRSSQ